MQRDADRLEAMAKRRKSVGYFPPDASRRGPHLERHMLIENIDHTIMPVGSYSRNKWGTYGVSLSPPSDQANECLQVAFISDEWEYDLASSLATFLRRAITVICYQGEAFYELVFDSDTKPTGFWLAPFPLGKVKVGRKVVRQMISNEIQRARKLKRPYVDIPKSDVLRVTFPPSWGGKQGLARLTAGLEHLGSSLPQFGEGSFGRLGEAGVEVTEYHTRRDCALAQITAKLGWHARFLLDRKVTEIYSVYRRLKFMQSVALIREHAIVELNRVVEPALKRLGLAGSLSVEGLPTWADTDQAIRRLLEGTLTFSDALAFTRGVM